MGMRQAARRVECALHIAFSLRFAKPGLRRGIFDPLKRRMTDFDAQFLADPARNFQ